MINRFMRCFSCVVPSVLMAVSVLFFAPGALAQSAQATYLPPADKPVSAIPFLQGNKKTQADQAWQFYQKNMGQPMSQWAAAEVRYPGGGTVFYPFSGPDVVTLVQLFPNAEHYVMAALQFAGEPANIATMSETRRARFQDKFLREWKKFTRLAFFRTDDLNDDLRDQQAQIGVTTTLIAFALYSGYDVTEVYPIALDPQSGEFVRTTGPWKSVRLMLSKAGKPVTLDYVSVDLSDSYLSKNEPMRAWLNGMSHNPVLLKAASHLLQMPSFSLMRDMIAANASMVVQDETGLDYSLLAKIGKVSLYGGFLYPHELFNRNRQASLAVAYKESKAVKSLPFAFSYNKTSERRSVQIVRRAP